MIKVLEEIRVPVTGVSAEFIIKKENKKGESFAGYWAGLELGLDSKEKAEFRKVLSDGWLSPKFKAALRILKDVARDRPGDKTLVYSNFPSLLAIFARFLDARGVWYVEYNGKTKKEERKKSLRVLRDEEECTVLLMSIKAGGTGLNIPWANNVIIMDPWWNPYVEEQAIGREYRKSQTKPVFVYRIISPGTIGDRVKEIQKRKEKEINAFAKRCVGEMERMEKGLVDCPRESA
ncbi:P-loop containing nucleoside triphosphate hydrolase protein [Coprinopsis marcescibilis]|uniref:P-loop containing nucleoside triphosphate hydrolase protein n=1 Tax=Coprinopsis marcescibilis TaxID=230819 RepID=A0A5C3LIN8_COPMA|nr:P-loop containing nucleoside triphosphate hydrolase protein [Coprinopsis marcescibilis]